MAARTVVERAVVDFAIMLSCREVKDIELKKLQVDVSSLQRVDTLSRYPRECIYPSFIATRKTEENENEAALQWLAGQACL